MLAIVIPYHKITFFEETLQSLANQTDQRFKVYIGDDASSANPLAILNKFKGQFYFEYHRFEENLGGQSLTKQWARCIELSSDEGWVMILGDDDFLSSNYVEAFYKHFAEIQRLDIKVVHFAVQRFYMDGSSTRTFEHPQMERATDSFFRNYFGSSHGSLSEQIFRKDAFKKHGFQEFPLAWGSDDLAWLRFSDFGIIYGINEAVVHFRISSENISRTGYKGELKKEAKYDLFKLLVTDYLTRFTKEQRLELVMHLERLAKRYQKMSFSLWLLVCKSLLLEGAFKEVYRLSYKCMRQMLKTTTRLIL